MKARVFLLRMLIGLFCLLQPTLNREVKRIVKKVYLHRSYYYGRKFKRLISKQFKRFDKSYIDLFKESRKCVHEHKEVPIDCEKICLGPNFKRIKQRYEMVNLRVKSIFDNIVQVLFNDNCMNNEVLKPTCKLLWHDVKMLDYYDYNTIVLLRKNKYNYIDDIFSKGEFERIFLIIRYLFNKFSKYMADRTDVRMVMLGRLFVILENKTMSFREKDHQSIVGNPNMSEVDENEFGLLFQEKLEREFRDPTKPLVDPDSSINNQLEVLADPNPLFTYFGSFFKPKEQEPQMSKAERLEIEMKFNQSYENDKLRLDSVRKEFQEKDDSKKVLEEMLKNKNNNEED